MALHAAESIGRKVKAVQQAMVAELDSTSGERTKLRVNVKKGQDPACSEMLERAHGLS